MVTTREVGEVDPGATREDDARATGEESEPGRTAKGDAQLHRAAGDGSKEESEFGYSSKDCEGARRAGDGAVGMSRAWGASRVDAARWVPSEGGAPR